MHMPASQTLSMCRNLNKILVHMCKPRTASAEMHAFLCCLTSSWQLGGVGGGGQTEKVHLCKWTIKVYVEARG